MEEFGDFPSLTNQDKSGQDTNIVTPEDFSDHIQGMKNEAFNNSESALKEFYWKDIPWMDYLKGKENITLTYVQQYIEEMGFSEEIISRLVPTIELLDESIIDEVESLFNEREEINPEAVVWVIWDFIKSKMAYSLTVWMSLLQHQIYEANLEKKLWYSEFSEQLKDYFSWDKFHLSEKSFSVITKAIKNRDISTITNEKLKSFITQAQKDLEQQWEINWEEYMLSLLDGNIEGALLFFNDNIVDVELNPQDWTVRDYLDGYKTWVCRHYSMIAQQIYTKLKEKYPSELEQSELLVVVDLENMHVYNKIVYVWEDSKLFEVNKDITNLILEDNIEPIFTEPENKSFYVQTDVEKLEFDIDNTLEYA